MTELKKPIDTILRAIREEREFRKEFSTVADSIVDKIYSYYTNPNCQCKSSIIDWINKNVDTTNTLIQKYDANIVAMTAEVVKAAEVAKAGEVAKVVAKVVDEAKVVDAAKATSQVPPTRPPNTNPMVNNPKARFGTVINIDKDPIAYTTLIKLAMSEGWVYRGCTVAPNTVDGKEVWSVFFY